MMAMATFQFLVTNCVDWCNKTFRRGNLQKKDFLKDDLTIKAVDDHAVMPPHDKSLRKNTSTPPERSKYSAYFVYNLDGTLQVTVLLQKNRVFMRKSS